MVLLILFTHISMANALTLCFVPTRIAVNPIHYPNPPLILHIKYQSIFDSVLFDSVTMFIEHPISTHIEAFPPYKRNKKINLVSQILVNY